MALLLLKGVSFKAGGRAIINDLDLAVEEGEVHALIGANGTGKSTLAYMVMGCEGYAPDKGDILFEGRRINGLSVHERARLGISMAWQEPVRFEGITVRSYLTLKNKDVDPAACLQMVGLPPGSYLDRMADRSLSGGQRKRVELASVLALAPRLAVLDEPDSGIDMLSTGDIVNVVNAFRASGTSLLLITHREEIALIADRASQLCWGRIICRGSPAEVAENFKSRRCLECREESCADA